MFNLLCEKGFLIIPLPSSGDCSPVSGPTTWLIFEWYIFDVCRYKLAVPYLDVFKTTFDIFQISPVSPSRFNHKTFISDSILCEGIFPFQAQKFRSFIGSRTWVLSFRSLTFFHCASRPRREKGNSVSLVHPRAEK